MFPDNFLFGTAVSAPQYEGASFAEGRGPSIWDVFSAIPGKIADGSNPSVTCDQYHLFREDIMLLKKLGIQSYRFSFSWSRIFPHGTGTVNPAGVQYYHEMIQALKENGIVPNATVYHWDLPYELQCLGGWCNRKSVEWFADYAEFLFREYGADIPLWATINEPIAVYVGYATGGFAPGLADEACARAAGHHLLCAHGEAVRRFRRLNLPDAKIGIVVDVWHHHPARPENKDDIALAERGNELTYVSYLNPIFKGCYTEYYLQYTKEHNCPLPILEGDMEQIAQPLDFFGLNCYNRVVDCADEDVKEQIRQVGGNFQDNGTEFYPKAIYDALHILKERFACQIPIYITENGTSDGKCIKQSDSGVWQDSSRIQYLTGFLEWVEKAIKEGFAIRGYYVWSLLDNWEWSAGFQQRMGLVHVDYETQKRTCKQSAYWYRDLIQSRILKNVGLK